MIQDSLLFNISLPFICGFASAWDTRKIVKGKWYQKIKKPSFNPPRYVFAPIWTYLYLSTGYALYLVRTNINQTNNYIGNWGIYAFWTQLLANILWSNLYFVKKEINLSLFDIIFLWLVSILTCFCFFNVNTLSGVLMVPYIAWATYAMVLTYSVKQLNPDFKDPK